MTYEVTLSGWNHDLRKIAVTKLLRQWTGRGLKESKDLLELVLDGTPVTLLFPTPDAAVTFAREVSNLGVICEGISLELPPTLRLPPPTINAPFPSSLTYDLPTLQSACGNTGLRIYHGIAVCGDWIARADTAYQVGTYDENIIAAAGARLEEIQALLDRQPNTDSEARFQAAGQDGRFVYQEDGAWISISVDATAYRAFSTSDATTQVVLSAGIYVAIIRGGRVVAAIRCFRGSAAIPIADDVR